MAKNGHGPAINRRDLGGSLWDQWSQTSTKYDAKVQEAKWQSFTPDSGVTLGTSFMKPSSMAMLRRRATFSASGRNGSTLPATTRTQTQSTATGTTTAANSAPGSSTSGQQSHSTTSSSAQILHASWMKPKPHC